MCEKSHTKLSCETPTIVWWRLVGFEYNFTFRITVTVHNIKVIFNRSLFADTIECTNSWIQQYDPVRSVCRVVVRCCLLFWKHIWDAYCHSFAKGIQYERKTAWWYAICWWIDESLVTIRWVRRTFYVRHCVHVLKKENPIRNEVDSIQFISRTSLAGGLWAVWVPRRLVKRWLTLLKPSESNNNKRNVSMYCAHALLWYSNEASHTKGHLHVVQRVIKWISSHTQSITLELLQTLDLTTKLCQSNTNPHTFCCLAIETLHPYWSNFSIALSVVTTKLWVGTIIVPPFPSEIVIRWNFWVKVFHKPAKNRKFLNFPHRFCTIHLLAISKICFSNHRLWTLYLSTCVFNVFLLARFLGPSTCFHFDATGSLRGLVSKGVTLKVFKGRQQLASLQPQDRIVKLRQAVG